MSEHISFSQIDAFETCPKRYKQERLEGVATIPSEPLLDGRHIHAVIEDIVRHCEDHGLPGVDAAAAADIVQSHFMRSNEPTTERFPEVMVMAKGFAKRYKHHEGELIELEQWIEIELAPGIPPLVGRLDDVRRYKDAEGTFIGNTDYKSSWSAEQSDANEFQLHLQGLMLKTSYPDERIKVRNAYVRFGIDSDWYEMKPWDYDNVRRRAIAVYERMRRARASGAYPPSPGKACSYCPIALQCVEALALREQGHLALTIDDAKKQVEDVLVLEAALKTRKASLKKWVDTNGPVAVERKNGKGVVETIEAAYKLPAASLTIADTPAAYHALGDELFALFNGMSKPKLKKYENDPRLEGLWTTTQGKPRFAIGKAVDEDDE
jgi:CRISPR/Cas system-associated exonuclease Cas4 (RecB family)